MPPPDGDSAERVIFAAKGCRGYLRVILSVVTDG